MDQNHHGWRPVPGQGNICPVCSVPHFPFCPSPPVFNPSPRFPSAHPDHHLNGYRPVAPHYAQGFGDPRNQWHGYPNYGRDDLGQYPNEFRQDGFGPRPNGYGGANGFVGEGERSYKKMRVAESSDPSLSGYANGNQDVFSRASFDDERRLKLIRDHGAVVGGPPSGVNAGYGFDNSRDGTSELAVKKMQKSYGNGNVPFVFGEADSEQQYYLQKSANEYQAEVPGMKRMYSGQSGGVSRDDYGRNYQPPHQPHAIQSGQVQNNLTHADIRDANQPYHANHGPVGYQSFPGMAPYGAPSLGAGGGYSLHPAGLGMNVARPPLPPSPPPPLPLDPLGYSSLEQKAHSPLPLAPPSSLFPLPSSSSRVSPPYPPAPGNHHLRQNYYRGGQTPIVSAGFVPEEYKAMQGNSLRQYAGQGPQLSSQQLPLQKPKIVDASHIFKPPHKIGRPDHFVIILRGFPGSGKSYLAKMLRDLEVENGGSAPRIYAIDDYFMTEVEKSDENGASKSSAAIKGKKTAVKKVMEYCYEPEMEEAYRSSMLKAYKKTVEEGNFNFVIVDDRNLRVADFAQFWAIGKTSGYEVYILEAGYKDPEGCAARNVHGFTLDDIQKMRGQWEEAPALYWQLDVKSLFRGDDLKESGIQEVDMDMGDDHDESLPAVDGKKLENPKGPPPDGDATNEDFSKVGEIGDGGGDHITEVRELGRSKWSENLEEHENDEKVERQTSASALSGLVQTYGKGGKSVRWGDQAGNTGFLIGAAKKANVLSLVIGSGAGYNLKSNPLPEDDNLMASHRGELKRQRSTFQERIRAERESFKVVFDRRRHRIGGLDLEEE
ncbi:uncharacterized protein LOC115741429 isoform X1 [Rhodamnia argentea]|uniref:Uncharacterized protein LOC115741429 isoform X1 n=1 Tax=Rhodamnia argentea TaxID=178133 RepID=A0A8B8P8T1_9MYRT|nr:uncharacterized protein LOC115741429 isoform X1 [Rhodamnia argentea]